MIINAANLGALNTIFRTGYNETFKAADPNHGAIITPVPITGAAISLVGLKAFAGMREWVGPRQHKNLEAIGYTIQPKLYEDTVDVRRTDIEDDTYGQYMNHIRGMAMGAAYLAGELVAQVLQGSHPQLGYDGKLLGANDHAMGGTTYDNLSTAALSRAALKTAIDFFTTLYDEAGKKIAITPTHLITAKGGAASWMAKELLTKQFVVESGVLVANETQNALQHLELPFITSSTFWAVVCANEVYRPVLLCERTKPELTAKTALDSDAVFENDIFSWGTRYRVTAAPGPWQTAYISSGA